MNKSYDHALAYAERWMDIIHQTQLTEAEGKVIIEESRINFAEHFNRGWLEYRKSVTESGDWASVEWTGSGACFRDVLGREFIDCLGGFGFLELGSANKEGLHTLFGLPGPTTHTN